MGLVEPTVGLVEPGPNGRRVPGVGRNLRRNQAFFRAALCEEFLRLTANCHFTVNAAARALGMAPSAFSGQGSMLRRYLGHGLAGLETHCGVEAGGCELTRRIAALGWFVEAARFFYFSGRRQRGALARAARHAADLPLLPVGWKSDTRARFLARLGLAEPPECPADLREELVERERKGKPILPPRITRLVKILPSRMRRYSTELPIGELARLPFVEISGRLEGLEPSASCRFTLELL